MTTYLVNHNGTEDWTDAPHGTTRDEDGRVLFANVGAAASFATAVAQSATADLLRDGLAPEDVAELLRDVPVQVIDATTDAVVAAITDPDALARHHATAWRDTRES